MPARMSHISARMYSRMSTHMTGARARARLHRGCQSSALGFHRGGDAGGHVPLNLLLGLRISVPNHIRASAAFGAAGFPAYVRLLSTHACLLPDALARMQAGTQAHIDGERMCPRDPRRTNEGKRTEGITYPRAGLDC